MISLRGRSPRAHVAAQPANETNVGVGVDEHFDIAEVANSLIDEEQDAVDDDHV
jgi:hypothetical protein